MQTPSNLQILVVQCGDVFCCAYTDQQPHGYGHGVLAVRHGLIAGPHKHSWTTRGTNEAKGIGRERVGVLLASLLTLWK